MSAVIPDPALTDWVPLGGVGGGGSMIALQEVLVPAGGQASIDFTNIPQGYRSLMIDLVGRVGVAVVASNLGLRCNGDAGANYYSEVLNALAAAPGAVEVLGGNSGRAGTLPGTSAPAGKPGFARIVIPDYAGTTFHKIWNVSGGEIRGITTGLVVVRMETGHWANAAAITSLSLIDTSGGSFVAGSRATLYGLAAPITTLPLTGVRAVWGRVNANGTIAGGTGFTVTKGGTGIYTVSFNTAFAAVPAVTVTLVQNTATFCAASAHAVGSVQVNTMGSGGGASDQAFNFIAMEAA